jgi:hypothetical protein
MATVHQSADDIAPHTAKTDHAYPHRIVPPIEFWLEETLESVNQAPRFES